MHKSAIHRRRFAAQLTAAVASWGAVVSQHAEAHDRSFGLRYLLASSIYGYTDVAQIIRQVRQTGATALDVWPRVHGNQREQLEAMGAARFAELLRRHDVTLGCITQFPLGPFRLQEELRLAEQLGCHTIVTGAEGPKGLKGDELKAAVRQFAERMKPHLELAQESGVTIAIENHSNSLIQSPDSLKWLVELRPSKHLAVALAPYHLPQREELISDLIRSLGTEGIAVFYAWQHGLGCAQKLPKEQELLQLPGRGPLDFVPLLSALREIGYGGWTEIFMHPVPRGIPILNTTANVTNEICRARDYLQACLQH